MVALQGSSPPDGSSKREISCKALINPEYAVNRSRFQAVHNEFRGHHPCTKSHGYVEGLQENETVQDSALLNLLECLSPDIDLEFSER